MGFLERETKIQVESIRVKQRYLFGKETYKFKIYKTNAKCKNKEKCKTKLYMYHDDIAMIYFGSFYSKTCCSTLGLC